MYGTVANIRVKAGHGDDLKRIMQQWNVERKPQVKGALSGYLFQLDSDPQDWIMVALFEDKESYEANADDPEHERSAWRGGEQAVDREEVCSARGHGNCEEEESWPFGGVAAIEVLWG